MERACGGEAARVGGKAIGGSVGRVRGDRRSATSIPQKKKRSSARPSRRFYSGFLGGTVHLLARCRLVQTDYSETDGITENAGREGEVGSAYTEKTSNRLSLSPLSLCPRRRHQVRRQHVLVPLGRHDAVHGADQLAAANVALHAPVDGGGPAVAGLDEERVDAARELEEAVFALEKKKERGRKGVVVVGVVSFSLKTTHRPPLSPLSLTQNVPHELRISQYGVPSSSSPQPTTCGGGRGKGWILRVRARFFFTLPAPPLFAPAPRCHGRRHQSCSCAGLCTRRPCTQT